MAENDELSSENGKKRPKKRELLRANTYQTDGELAEKSRVWRLLFLEDEAAFIALDPVFGGSFATDWLSEIEKFEAMPTTENLVDEHQQSMLDVEEARKKFTEALQLLDYYLPKAYPDMKGIRDEFGLTKILTPDYKRGIRQVVLGFALLEVANKRSAVLLAAGLPPTWLTDMENLCNDYAGAELKAEFQKLQTIAGTNNRIRQFNLLFKLHRQVAKAADVIFMNNKVRADLYRTV
jgi:hypothetical protein